MTDSLFSSAVLGTVMPVELTWSDLVYARRRRDHRLRPRRARQGRWPADDVLVCMAASVAMLQMKYLLPLTGKAGDSFITNDLMRLPLGILTGVGFIGGGAILRRGSLVVGVTTAATLWYATVVGLCFGGGQMLLGWTATAVGVFVLWGLRWFENAMSVVQHASLAITLNEAGPSEAEIRRALEAAAIAVRDISLQSGSGNRTLTF